MRIAIIGSGISGLVAADRLWESHQITLFEANDYVGGHTHTVNIDGNGATIPVDTGFIVFNPQTYPNFCALLKRLGVASQETSMSLSLRCDASGLEYRGDRQDVLNGLFAQRRNLLNPRHWKMLRDIARFSRHGVTQLAGVNEELTVGEFLERHGYSDWFARRYLVPIGSAVWSCPRDAFQRFPVRFIVEFFANHGLLQMTNRPTWRSVVGGSQTYVRALTRPFRDRIQLSTPVREVTRTAGGTRVRGDDFEADFDHVIFACHSDQALRLLASPDNVERDVLREFPYQRNEAVLHSDPRVMPRLRRAWASWNYHLQGSANDAAVVTYYMNLLQNLDVSCPYFVTLNGDSRIDPDHIHQRMVYHHPVFTTTRAQAQSRHHELIDRAGVSYCGAYWGNGFHEDGVNSGLAVADRLLSASLRESPCPAPST